MKNKINLLILNVAKKSFPGISEADFSIAPPPGEQEGDLAVNIAFALAKPLKKSPKEIAAQIAAELGLAPDIEKVRVGGDGFLNIALSQDFLAKQVAAILENGSGFGASTINKGKKARVEFISANPTGPLHIGNARGGPLGDVISNVLAATGYKVLREYIDNDRGNQVRQLGETLAVHAGLLEKPKSKLAYNAPYARELAKKLEGKSKDPQKLGELGVKMLFDEVIADAKAMGVSFDYIVHESDLQKKAPAVLSELRSHGLLTEHDGAVWFKFGDSEAVVVKNDGSYVYFAADIVYHKEKFSSGYDLVVDVLGSNTIGHVPKLLALTKAFGHDKNFKVVLYQYVRIKRGQEVVKMSKRAGNFVTAREVVDEVGKDAFRFFMLLHDAATHMDFDLELAKKKSQENPVYYVQYAAVRCKSILRKSEILNPKFETNSKFQISNYKIQDSVERKLIVQLAVLPDVVEELAQTLKVHQLTHYAVETAKLFHDFYERLPVIENKKVDESRLAIVRATLTVLENTLQLLGVSVPDHM